MPWKLFVLAVAILCCQIQAQKYSFSISSPNQPYLQKSVSTCHQQPTNSRGNILYSETTVNNEIIDSVGNPSQQAPTSQTPSNMAIDQNQQTYITQTSTTVPSSNPELQFVYHNVPPNSITTTKIPTRTNGIVINNLPPEVFTNAVPPNSIITTQTTAPVVTSSASTAPMVTQQTAPVHTTTVIDNSLSNSLANALQLLIVSNLIESTMNPSTPILSEITADSVTDIPQTTNHPNDKASLEVVSNYQTPYSHEQNNVDIVQNNPFSSQFIDVNPNYSQCGCGKASNVASNCNSCGCTQQIINITPSYGACGCGQQINYQLQNDPNLSMCGCNKFTDVVADYFSGPSFGSSAEMIAPKGPTAPMTAEIVLPAAIPAQLTCNFGYVPTTIPVVSVDVEPLSSFHTCAFRGKSTYF